MSETVFLQLVAKVAIGFSFEFEIIENMTFSHVIGEENSSSVRSVSNFLIFLNSVGNHWPDSLLQTTWHGILFFWSLL